MVKDLTSHPGTRAVLAGLFAFAACLLALAPRASTATPLPPPTFDTDAGDDVPPPPDGVDADCYALGAGVARYKRLAVEVWDPALATWVTPTDGHADRWREHALLSPFGQQTALAYGVDEAQVLQLDRVEVAP